MVTFIEILSYRQMNTVIKQVFVINFIYSLFITITKDNSYICLDYQVAKAKFFIIPF